MEQITKKFPQDVRFIYRHFPLNIHDKAILAAQAAEAAGLQGKFWEMHDALFAKQKDWTSMSVTVFGTFLQEQAKLLGIDATKFAQDLNNAGVVQKVQDSLKAATDMGLSGTPSLAFNGRFFDVGDEATITYIIDVYKQLFSLESKRVLECPAMTIDKARQYTAVLETNKGNITLQLYADKAPLAVNSFIFLAKRGWFNDTPFHRVLKTFVAQTGDPSGTGIGNPGYLFNNEIIAGLKFDKAGVVGMANSGANTNGSQFFITYAAQAHLDGAYTVFGQVTAGLDVLQSLTERNPAAGGTLPDPDKILKVTIEEK